MSIAQGTTVLEKIRQRGHWFVAIHPVISDASRVPDRDLFPIIEQNSIQIRRWNYPHVSRNPPLWGPDWVGQNFDRDGTIEVWRFHTNGLFAHYFAIDGDWSDESKFWPANPHWRPNQEIDYLDIIDSFVEIFEFAARLAQSPAGDRLMRVEVSLKNLQGRRLVSTGKHIRPHERYLIQVSEWSDRWEGSQTELIARPRELAAHYTQNFLLRFGIDASLDVLGHLQKGIGLR